jgi:hypothetical protein
MMGGYIIGSNSETPWYLRSDVVAYVGWAGTALSLVGLVITIVGFVKAISAARAAENEATVAVKSVKALKVSLSAASLAYSQSQLGMLLQFVTSGYFAPAQSLLMTLRREILRYAGDLQASENTLVDLRKRFDMVATQISRALNNTGNYELDKLQKALSGGNPPRK